MKKYISQLALFAIPILLIPNSAPKAMLLWVSICLALAVIQRWSKNIFSALAYLAFFSTSLLSFFGYMNVLTGLDSGIVNSTGLLWGYSFFSLSLSFILFADRQFEFKKIALLIQPIRFFTGPIINNLHLGNLKISKKRLFVNFTWIILGIFYLYVIAPGLKIFQQLKPSTNFIDILVFSTTFEMYVYFNFAGASFLVMGTIKCFGINCVNNFNAPFSGRNIIEYWHRWHRSLSHLCKIMFYLPIKSRLGLCFAVFSTFMSSAMWHGITTNFFLWGAFHSSMWLITYKMLKLGNRIANYIILFPTIIFGRLLFSESNTSLLIEKILSLSNFGGAHDQIAINFGKTDLVLLFAGVGIIFGEIVSPNKFQNYKIFRKGWMLVFLLLMIFLFAIDDSVVVYGAR